MRAQSPSQMSLVGQGAFWISAGLWPVLHLKSFAKVTGPKPEGWLAKSVGMMMVVVGSSLLVASKKKKASPEAKWLAVSSAIVLGGVDVFYVAKRRIKPTYLFDAAAQAGILAMWGVSEFLERKASRQPETPPAVLERRVGQWDIAPGETLNGEGERDIVEEASMESFPASDSPSYQR